MSGYYSSGVRDHATNLYYFTPYHREPSPEPTTPARQPTYDPPRSRASAGTKYDVRATYPKDHILQDPNRIKNSKSTPTQRFPCRYPRNIDNIYSYWESNCIRGPQPPYIEGIRQPFGSLDAQYDANGMAITPLALDKARIVANEDVGVFGYVLSLIGKIWSWVRGADATASHAA